MRASSAVLVGLVALGGVACSSSDPTETMPTKDGGGGDAGDAGAGDAGFLQEEDFCARLAERVCTWAMACNNFSDCTTWPGYSRAVGECAAAIRSMEMGFLRYDGKAAARCVGLDEAFDCEGPGPQGDPALREQCRKVFPGTVEEGAECASSNFAFIYDECTEGFCLRDPGPSGRECLGQCAAYKKRDEGCTAVGDQCTKGLFCNDGVCGDARKRGEDCGNAICATDLLCVGDDPYTCHAIVEVGGDCSAPHSECASPAVCIGGKCTEDAKKGEPCREDASCLGGLFCRPNEAQTVFSCHPLVAAGAACDPDRDQCVPNYGCNHVEPHTCVTTAKGKLNESCGISGCEENLWCLYTGPHEGTCKARVAAGQTCQYDGSCVEGLFCGQDAKCHPPGGMGEPCSLSLDESCTGDLFCDRATVTCKPPRGLDQRCYPGNVLGSCQAGLYCACLSEECPSYSGIDNPDDVCKAQLADGETCDRNEKCLGGYCVDGKCDDEPANFNVVCSR
ncbi:MAG: hypothetical protein KC416_00735 [Myxococcales bacterium]|nr:hypothetical protein [Myxococcales bacterium]